VLLGPLPLTDFKDTVFLLVLINYPLPVATAATAPTVESMEAILPDLELFKAKQSEDKFLEDKFLEDKFFRLQE
jgi:hypothetical protein